MIGWIKASLSLVLAIVLSTNASAERKVSLGEYEIHYNAVYSMDMLPETARAVQLPRGRHFAWILVSVRKGSGVEAVGVSAQLSGTAINLLGQKRDLTFKPIKEANAQYYMAAVRFDDEDVLRYVVDVRPDGSERVETIQFQQHYTMD